jgi:hypothetical protein
MLPVLSNTCCGLVRATVDAQVEKMHSSLYWESDCCRSRGTMRREHSSTSCQSDALPQLLGDLS